jgi:hypothetical protein
MRTHSKKIRTPYYPVFYPAAGGVPVVITAFWRRIDSFLFSVRAWKGGTLLATTLINMRRFR